MATKAKEKAIVNVQPLRTMEEIREFRDAIEVTSKSYKKRNLLLFNLGIETGLRISDILNLKIEDVKNKTELVIREKKTGKKRSIYIDKLFRQISEYLEDLDKDTEYLFPTRIGDKPITTTQAYRILAKAADSIDRNDIGTHTLRKTFGYHYYKHTKDAVILMKIFNHESQAVTKRYIGIEDEEIKDSLKDFTLQF